MLREGVFARRGSQERFPRARKRFRPSPASGQCPSLPDVTGLSRRASFREGRRYRIVGAGPKRVTFFRDRVHGKDFLLSRRDIDGIPAKAIHTRCLQGRRKGSKNNS
jgi:hypothetical protein